MALRTDSFDLGGLRLSTGEGRRLDLDVVLDPFQFAGERYLVQPGLIPVRLDISRTTGNGYALRLRFWAQLVGPCMRCLADADADADADAASGFDVDAREISQPGEGDELDSPYVDRGVLELRAWARDALALTLPAQILCRSDCAGLCEICGVDLNLAGPEHGHDRGPDPRWAKLSELRFDP